MVGYKNIFLEFFGWPQLHQDIEFNFYVEFGRGHPELALLRGYFKQCYTRSSRVAHETQKQIRY